jgi:hypothetical protein
MAFTVHSKTPVDEFQNSVIGSTVGTFISWQAISSHVHFHHYI